MKFGRSQNPEQDEIYIWAQPSIEKEGAIALMIERNRSKYCFARITEKGLERLGIPNWGREGGFPCNHLGQIKILDIYSRIE